MKRFFLLIYYLAYSFIYVGWLSHRSLSPSILQYSTKYFVFLIAMSSFFFLPIVIHLYLKLVGRKGLWYSLIASLIFLFILYFIFSLRYYYTQKHPFDPFLQNPISRFEIVPRDKKDNVFRILCLGGSTTENLAIPQEGRYPNVLGVILKKQYPSVKIEVLNAGKNWYTIKHSMISYVTYWEEWNPDLVIVMHAINDLSRSFSPPDYAVGEYNELWTHFYGPAIRGAKPPTFEEYLLSYFEIPINAWYSKLRLRAVDYPPERYISRPAFEKNLRKLVKYVKNNKSGIILVSQPSIYRENMTDAELRSLYFGKTIANERINFMQREHPSSKSFFQAMKSFNEITKKVALSEDVIFVDAANFISKDFQNFRDDAHYTKKGTKLLAEVIAETIIEEDLIEKEIK